MVNPYSVAEMRCVPKTRAAPWSSCIDFGAGGVLEGARFRPKYGYHCLAISVPRAAGGTSTSMWNVSWQTGRWQRWSLLDSAHGTT